MAFDLKTDDGLRRACGSVDFDSKDLKDRIEKTKTLVEEVSNASREFFVGEEYQERLWENNPICYADGRAPRVEIRKVTQDSDFLDWFYSCYRKIWSLDSQDRTESLCEFVDELSDRMRKYSLHASQATPALRIYRALAALFHENFTSIASRGELYRLAIHMGIEGHPVVVHHSILDRLAKVLGSNPMTGIK